MTKPTINFHRHLIRSGTLLILVGLVLAGILTNRVIPRRTFHPPPITQPTPPPPYSPEPSRMGTPTLAPTPTPPIHYIQAFVTYYGWPDNGPPPGNGIAYPQSQYQHTYHEVAGGIGTYQDPVTFASSANLFKIGTKLYVPYLKKYVVKEDLCGSCGSSALPHIDIWMESNESFASELDQCQGAYTRESVAVEVAPPPGRPVNPTPLFNKSTGTCLN